MTTRLATFVTVNGTAATISTVVCSVHRTWEAAQRAAGKARLEGLPREVVSAQVIALMQAGACYTSAVQSLAGAPIEAVRVNVGAPQAPPPRAVEGWRIDRGGASSF